MKIDDLKPEQVEKAANMLKAIAHPIRMAILGLLSDDNQLTVTEIHEQLNIEQSTASHHLGILRDKDVLAAKRDGKNTFYNLKYPKMAQVVECVKSCACE